jgi:hypothetical protein
MIIYLSIYIYDERENKSVLVDLSEGTTEGRRGRMLENAKH